MSNAFSDVWQRIPIWQGSVYIHNLSDNDESDEGTQSLNLDFDIEIKIEIEIIVERNN